MKKILTKLGFKMASILYKYDIIAPEILKHDSMIVLSPGYSEGDLRFYKNKQSEIKTRMYGK